MGRRLVLGDWSGRGETGWAGGVTCRLKSGRRCRTVGCGGRVVPSLRLPSRIIWPRRQARPCGPGPGPGPGQCGYFRRWPDKDRETAGLQDLFQRRSATPDPCWAASTWHLACGHLADLCGSALPSERSRQAFGACVCPAQFHPDTYTLANLTAFVPATHRFRAVQGGKRSWHARDQRQPASQLEASSGWTVTRKLKLWADSQLPRDLPSEGANSAWYGAVCIAVAKRRRERIRPYNLGSNNWQQRPRDGGAEWIWPLAVPQALSLSQPHSHIISTAIPAPCSV